jgi:O-antigen biosynthesis protein WbqV
MPGRFFIVMRARVAYAHDIVMAAVSFVLSLFLRVGEDLTWYGTDELVLATGVFTTVAAIVFWSMRMYRGVWRYASLNDLLTIVRAVSLVILVFFVFMFVLTRLEDLPRSLPVINWFILIALLGGPRFLYRALKDRRFEWQLQPEGQHRVPVLLAGADDGSELFIRATSGTESAVYRAVGIVATRPERVGRDIHGVQVMGTLDDVPAVVEALDRRGDKPQRLVITKDDMDGARVRALLETADGLGMSLARTPRLHARLHPGPARPRHRCRGQHRRRVGAPGLRAPAGRRRPRRQLRVQPLFDRR